MTSAAVQATDAAIARVDAAAQADWKAAALDAIRYLADRRSEFTTDAVWEVLARRHPEVTTHDNRAMGAVLRHARSEGLVEPTDAFHISVRPECHRCPKRVWRAL